MADVVISRRTFAGYWEYLPEDAIFTAPPCPAWSGGALIASDGKLVGIGSPTRRQKRRVYLGIIVYEFTGLFKN